MILELDGYHGSSFLTEEHRLLRLDQLACQKIVFSFKIVYSILDYKESHTLAQLTAKDLVRPSEALGPS